MFHNNLVRNAVISKQIVRLYCNKQTPSSFAGIKETAHLNNQNGNSYNDRSSVHIGKNISKTTESRDDSRLRSYSGSGHVNLQGVTQSTVPKPFTPPQKDSPEKNAIGMGSSSANQSHKLVSNSLRDTHQSKNFSTFKMNGILGFNTVRLFDACYLLPYNAQMFPNNTIISTRCMSSQPQLSQKDKLKNAVKDYGSTVIVFHVAISLMSLGVFYLAVSSGLDMTSFLSTIGVSDSIVKNNVATGASTFVVAYAVHKVFAPVRIAITLSATPFIVRYLRRVGILKKKI